MMAGMELRTQRLLLRRWRPDDRHDVAVAFDIYHRWEVSRWLGATPSVWPDEASSQQSLARWQTFADAHPGYGLWAVVPQPANTDDQTNRAVPRPVGGDSDDGHPDPVGTVLLMPLRDADDVPTGHVEVGWHFHPDVWGHGYATEASRAMLDHGWSLGLSRIEAIALPDNAPSIKVMERLGMTYQGQTDRWYGATFTWYRIERSGPH